MLAQRGRFVAEETVKAQCVVDLGRRQLEERAHLADGVGRNAAMLVLHDVERRQRDGPLVRIFDELGPNPLLNLLGQGAHRSNSAAMMLRLPSTATTSLSVCPLIKCGKTAKWMYDGGRVRARYALIVP